MVPRIFQAGQSFVRRYTTADTGLQRAQSQGADGSRRSLAWSRACRCVCGTVILVVSLFLALDSMRQDAAGVDEFDHLASGFAFLRQIDLHGRLRDTVGGFQEHPPLIKGIAAIPLLFLDVQLPPQAGSGPLPSPYNYFYKSTNDPDRLLFWGRLPMLLLFMLLALFIAKWARELYGDGAGLFALLLAACNTTLLAYGRYIMTDFGITLFYTLSLYAFLRCLKNPSPLNITVAGVVLGLAQVAKLSAVFLVPIFAVLAVYHLFCGAPAAQPLSRKRDAVHLLKVLTVICLLSGGVVLSVYSLLTWHITQESQAQLIQELLGHLRSPWPAQLVASVAAISKPLGQYALGLAVLGYHGTRGHTGFFLGHVATHGWWTYFPVAFLLKTQLALIILLVLTVFMKPKAPASTEPQLLMLAAAVYALIAICSGMNIGVRHLLPIYPLVIIWASQAIQWPTQRGVVSVAKVVMLTGLTAWYVLSTLGSHPHYVTYFNELIGGPRNGYQYLSDSNVDMGQDLKRVSAYLREAGITEPHVLCLGETNLWGCHGVAYHMPHAKLWGAEYPRALPAELPTGFFVIGKTPRWLARGRLKKNAAALQQWKALAKLLDNVAPVHTIGHSVDIYYLTPHKTLLSNQPQTHARRIE